MSRPSAASVAASLPAVRTLMSQHSPTYQPPPDEGLDIRYIDDDLLVVDKPAGLLSVPGGGRASRIA